MKVTRTIRHIFWTVEEARKEAAAIKILAPNAKVEVVPCAQRLGAWEVWYSDDE